MTALIAFLLGNPTILVGIVMAALGLGWGVKQRRAGAASERAKQVQREAKARTVADEVDNDVGAMPPQDAREALKKWHR